MADKEIKDAMVEMAPEERAAAWEEYVRAEVNALLDTFLPESTSGNVGVKYDHPVKSISPKTGKADIDTSVANGVFLSIKFDFAAPIKFEGEVNPE
jgi:hypothetical protein